MDNISPENTKLSAKRIALQKAFKKYNEKNDFSYKDWINPPSGHFYQSCKNDLDAINKKMAPPLQYQK